RNRVLGCQHVVKNVLNLTAGNLNDLPVNLNLRQERRTTVVVGTLTLPVLQVQGDALVDTLRNLQRTRDRDTVIRTCHRAGEILKIERQALACQTLEHVNRRDVGNDRLASLTGKNLTHGK